MVIKTSKNGRGNSSQERTVTGGLTIRSVFCPSQCDDPFSTVEWDDRSAQIRGEAGEVVFEQEGCVVPKDWSQLATNVVVSKYFYGEQATPEREQSVRQLIERVASTIAEWGWQEGFFATTDDRDRYYRELAWLCLHQYGSFNSPVWFNVGLYDKYGLTGCSNGYRWNSAKKKVERAKGAYMTPQVSACFIQAVEDSMEGIMNLATSEAMLFKYGSGTGTDLTPLRSHREKLAGGGKPSGPLSFMKVYDQIAAVIKSGGKTRRAAKMQSLKISHPDILEFIEAKLVEEAKALALIRQGYEPNFNGEAYSSVFFQNANFSIRVTDEFMKAVEEDGDWTTKWITDPSKDGPTFKARFLLERIADGTWKCGDPGLQYDTTINDWHTCPKGGAINASNPCSEYMFVDNSACNLASLNLMKFRNDEGNFDAQRFRDAVNIFITAQEIVVDRAGYPTREITENSHKYRPLGLGYTNLGALLMASGLPYDSDEGRALGSAITAVLTGQAYLTSSRIAGIPASETSPGPAGFAGPFPAYGENQGHMLAVMEMHRKAVDDIGDSCPRDLVNSARTVWDECIESGMAHGYRNAQATVLAPTGTISFMMDCDTTGIEPDLALVKYKQLAGGGMLKIVNQTVPLALEVLGYEPAAVERIIAYIDEFDTVEGCTELDERHLPVFDCAFKPKNGERSIGWRAHVKMMAAAQPFLSGAISKTVNMPHESSVEDVIEAYMEGWKLGLKALAIYRDGSKESQPLSTTTEEEKAEEEDTAKRPKKPFRRHLADTRASITHKFSVSGHEGYITVGLYEDGEPGEIFITMAKEGSTIGGLMDVFGTVVSMSLQYGVPLDVLVKKFAHSRFEPAGWTSNKDIPMAKSLVDYIFRWLGIQFIPGYREKNTPKRDTAADGPDGGDVAMLTVEAVPKATEKETAKPPAAGSSAAGMEELARHQAEAPLCDNCGALTVRSGMCYLCYNCGSTSGCG